jgi:hypothetical protein
VLWRSGFCGFGNGDGIFLWRGNIKEFQIEDFDLIFVTRQAELRSRYRGGFGWEAAIVAGWDRLRILRS